MVKTYTEWVEAVEKEAAKLREVWDWLNPNGERRLASLEVLLDLADFSFTATDLLDRIENGDLTKNEREAVKSATIGLVIHRLKDIAFSEENN